MTPPCPAPQQVPDLRVQAMKGCFGNDRLVIERPSPQYWSQPVDQMILTASMVSLDDCPDLAVERLNVLLARLD